ncbi:MAG: hypothetical protein AAGA63_08575 [Pseudomonadota bacterium]
MVTSNTLVGIADFSRVILSGGSMDLSKFAGTKVDVVGMLTGPR